MTLNDRHSILHTLTHTHTHTHTHTEAAAQKRSHDFSDELFSFCGNTLTNFEITFWTKAVENRLSKKYLKRRKTRPRFFWVLVTCISVRKNYRKLQLCWCRARKVENLARFLCNFDPYFSNIRRVRKRCEIYIESIGIYCKNIESIESMEVTTLESNALPFHFAWRVLWYLIIQFSSTIQLNDKSVWS